MDDDNEIPLNEIASFSVLWSMISTKSLHFCCLCSQMRFWMSLFSLGSSDEGWSLMRRSSRLVITSSISAGTGSSWILCRPVGMLCDAALSRIVLRIFSSLWQSVEKGTLAQGGLHLESVSVLVGLL